MPKPAATEHEIQGAIIDLIRARGGVVTRVNSGSAVVKSKSDRCYRVQLADKGTSDIIALYRGVYLAIEVKAASGKPSSEQIAFLESVAEAGGVGVVAYDSEFVNHILDGIENVDCDFTLLQMVYERLIPDTNRLFVKG